MVPFTSQNKRDHNRREKPLWLRFSAVLTYPYHSRSQEPLKQWKVAFGSLATRDPKDLQNISKDRSLFEFAQFDIKCFEGVNCDNTGLPQPSCWKGHICIKVKLVLKPIEPRQTSAYLSYGEIISHVQDLFTNSCTCSVEQYFANVIFKFRLVNHKRPSHPEINLSTFGAPLPQPHTVRNKPRNEDNKKYFLPTASPKERTNDQVMCPNSQPADRMHWPNTHFSPVTTTTHTHTHMHARTHARTHMHTHKHVHKKVWFLCLGFAPVSWPTWLQCCPLSGWWSCTVCRHSTMP